MSDYFIGEIRLFSGNYVPENFVPCDGRLLPITGNEALYSLLGVIWGGDGKVNFAVPDLRSRILVGQGTGPGLSARAVGQTGGVETNTLTTSTIPAHTHPWNTQAATATSNTPSNAVLAQMPGHYVNYVKQANTTGLFPFPGSMVQSTGGGLPHDNIMPSLALTYMICTVGLYPSRP